MIIITTIVLIVTLVYIFFKYISTYWWRKGFPYIEPTILIGNMSRTVKGKTSFMLNIWEHYKASEEPFTGVYLLTSPSLLVRDPDLVRRILVTDFASFHDRGIHCNTKTDFMSENLFCLPGAQWKALRYKLTPTFTSGKLKAMFPTILNIGQRLQTYLTKSAEKNDVIEMKNMSLRYTLDIISNVIFGYEVNSIDFPDNEFHAITRRFSEPTIYESIMGAFVMLSPKILDFFKLVPTPKYLREFITRVVKETIEYREKNNVQRKDFMQLLIQIRNSNEVKADGDWKIDSVSKKTMTIEQCAASVSLFNIAGNETTSATISFAMHELAHHPRIMEKVVKEIDEILEKHNNEITYDVMKEMTYLDLCIKETIRKYPALPALNRITTADYPIPNSNLTLEKGTSVIISLMGFHRDEKYFPNPDEFDPDRFLDENKRYDERVYLPFGEGPRNCIGFRMGHMVAKCCLIYLLSKFKFESMTKKELEFDPGAITLVAKHGIKFKFSLRN